jgi:hypothetical protein
MHPYFIGNVSEFAVEFAGDYDTTPGVDTHSSGSNKQVVWYSGYGTSGAPTGNPAVATPPVSAEGFVTAYTGGRPIYLTSPPSAAAPLTNKAAFIFCPKGRDWPQLLRIRYRINDPQGKLAGSDGEPGRIFEQIIRLPE